MNLPEITIPEADTEPTVITARIQPEHSECTKYQRAIQDTLDILSGKWKVNIIGSLGFGNKRFMELQREIQGIGAKMLSKELRDLEVNELVFRVVHNTKPVTVEYGLTDYGSSLKPIIQEMALWGMKHRRRIIGGIKGEK